MIEVRIDYKLDYKSLRFEGVDKFFSKFPKRKA
jgi:hypothetical protein